MQDKFNDKFREELSGYQAKYEPGDWDRMEKLLDHVETVAPTPRRWLPAMLAASVVINLFFLGWFALDMRTHDRQGATLAQTETLLSLPHGTDTVVSAEANQLTASGLAAAFRASGEHRTSRVSVTGTRTEQQHTAAVHSLRFAASPSAVLTGNSPIEATRVTSEGTGVNNLRAGVPLLSQEPMLLGASQQPEEAVVPTIIEVDQAEVAESGALAALEDETPDVSIRPWSWGVTASPDFNWVKGGTAPSPRFTFGAHLARKLGKKIELALGLAVSQKTYHRREEAQPVQSTSYLASSVSSQARLINKNAGIELEKMVANRTQVEIPLTATVEVGSSPHNRTFLQAGLVGCYTLDERYRYEYKPQSPQQTLVPNTFTNGMYNLDSQTEQAFSHEEVEKPSFFAALHVAAGKEWALHPNLRLQIAPYLQIPMQYRPDEKQAPFTAGLQTTFRMPLAP
ncbi:hypothetical protein SAMN05421823_101130 [Catalinimonas alkaloidigena]|uniref:Outer membrane protein beta-barrel domain-containing protein n=1 Tax=Catalinimonas alkaloidigena TaxID=1075417 RepID=A0A1G8WMA8_9BACT|nr:hypothetical protein [Catalinimonas alkaloidigena]SDJ79492.1 hypothetical protein SAMN05421823_101130 [Catalinimonas alkaloidigena]